MGRGQPGERGAPRSEHDQRPAAREQLRGDGQQGRGATRAGRAGHQGVGALPDVGGDDGLELVPARPEDHPHRQAGHAIRLVVIDGVVVRLVLMVRHPAGRGAA